MTDIKLELKDGWEIIGGDDAFRGVNPFALPDYEYRVIRRRKVDEMPGLKVGDAVKYGSNCGFYTVVEINDSNFALADSWGRVDYEHLKSVQEIRRDGALLWERKP
jgi:hypothetical protein